MPEIAIRVEELGKAYRIGSRAERHDTLARTLLAMAKSPIENFRRLRRLADLADDSEEEDVVWALRDVSLEVKQGEVVGLIGRNGAGKSTLLKVLSRITEPTRGRAIIRGRVSSLLEVGTGFHPELTGRENVYMNGSILGMTRAEITESFDAIVEFAGVERFIDTPIKRYSSGMTVRLAFSVAAHIRPEILLVDEVLAVGDHEFQRKCLQKMKTISEGGRTVVFVSHNMAAIERLCQRAYLLGAGRVEACGDTEEVVRAYLETGGGQRFVWEAAERMPEEARVRAVRLVDVQSGEPLTVVTSRMHIGLEIECVVPRALANLQLAFCVFSALGQPVFSSNPLDDGQPQPTTPGLHRYRVALPPDVFIPQRYSVTVSLYAARRPVDNLAEALVFDVNRVASKENVQDGGRPGLVFLPCRWTHRVLEPAS